MFRKITSTCLAFCLSVLLAFSLTGCMFIPSWKKVDVRYDSSEIVSVELYDLTQRSYDGRFYGLDEDIDQMETELDPIDTLDAERYADFVTDLEKLTFSNHLFIVLAAMDPSYNYYGYTVKITYQNGDYDIISHTAQLYDAEENYAENNWSCDEEKWDSFIKEYFTVDTPEKPTPAPVA